MRMLFLILFFYLNSSLVLGQNKLPSTVFHKHIQTCHYIGTTEDDYVIKLYSDSTIEIARFTSSYWVLYKSVIEIIYSGKYLKNGDSVLVTYSGQSQNIRHKNPPATKISKESPDLFVKYPPPVFLLSEKSIRPATGIFPILEKSSIRKIATIGLPSHEIGLKNHNFINSIEE